MLNDLKGMDYNIAIHGIHDGNLEEKKCIAKSILKEGLKLQHGWRTILSTTIALRNIKENPNLAQDMENYQYGSEGQCNIIAKIPNFISNSKGEKIFLGFPPINKETAGQQYSETCILDLVCAKLGKIPPEFIFGYYTSSLAVHKNADYYDELSQEKKDELFEEIKDNIPELHRKISSYVVNKDINSLEKLKNVAETFKQSAVVKLVDNSIDVIEKMDPVKKFSRDLQRGTSSGNNKITIVENNNPKTKEESQLDEI